MEEISDINTIHYILLDIAKEFHKVCINNNIPYYMCYGTMLGAIRHKGFIPWDDDMDFCIDYQYYDKVIQALKNELPPRYKVLTRNDKKGAVGGYLKIEDTRTILDEGNKLHIDENTGVFVDIFLLYNSRIDLRFKPILKLIRLLSLIQSYRFYNKANIKGYKKWISYVIRYFFFWLKKDWTINFIEKFLIPKSGNYFSTYSSIYNSKDIIKRSVYGKPVIYSFENTQLLGVENPDAYLTQIYGDYMKLPPIEKRRTHIQNVYYQ